MYNTPNLNLLSTRQGRLFLLCRYLPAKQKIKTLCVLCAFAVNNFSAFQPTIYKLSAQIYLCVLCALCGLKNHQFK